MMRRNRDMDERAIAIQNRAGKITGDVLMWMLLADMALRSKRPAWTMLNGFPVDILVMMGVAAVVHTTYMARMQAFGPRRWLLMAFGMVLACGLAALIAWMITDHLRGI